MITHARKHTHARAPARALFLVKQRHQQANYLPQCTANLTPFNTLWLDINMFKVCCAFTIYLYCLFSSIFYIFLVFLYFCFVLFFCFTLGKAVGSIIISKQASAGPEVRSFCPETAVPQASTRARHFSYFSSPLNQPLYRLTQAAVELNFTGTFRAIYYSTSDST